MFNYMYWYWYLIYSRDMDFLLVSHNKELLSQDKLVMDNNLISSSSSSIVRYVCWILSTLYWALQKVNRKYGRVCNHVIIMSPYWNTKDSTDNYCSFYRLHNMEHNSQDTSSLSQGKLYPLVVTPFQGVVQDMDITLDHRVSTLSSTNV